MDWSRHLHISLVCPPLGGGRGWNSAASIIIFIHQYLVDEKIIIMIQQKKKLK